MSEKVVAPYGKLSMLTSPKRFAAIFFFICGEKQFYNITSEKLIWWKSVPYPATTFIFVMKQNGIIFYQKVSKKVVAGYRKFSRKLIDLN